MKLSVAFIFFGIVLTCFHTELDAQDSSVIPGELELLRGPINDTDKARTYNWICFNYAYDNPEEGIRFGRLGLELSHKLGFKKGIGDAHSNMGFCFTCESKFDSARVHYEKAIQAFRNTGNDCWTKVPTANLGSNYFKAKDYVKALELYLEVARIEEGCEDRGFKSTSIYSVGTVYNAMEKYEQAITYFEKAYTIDLANGDTSKMADRLMAMGNAYTGLGKLKEARQKFNESVELCKVVGEKYRTGFAYMGLAKLEYKEGNYNEAIREGELAREHFKAGERTSDWLGACTLLGELYIKGKDWPKALTVLKEGVVLAEDLKVQTDRLSVYEKLALTNAKLGMNSDAALYFEKYLALRDTVQAQEINDRLADYSTLYETEKKQKELLEEREKNLAADLALKDQQFQKRIFLFGGILSLLFALVLINRYRLKQRIAKELEEKNKLIEREKARAEEGERFKQQFLANMSHEMRTPVSVIAGLTSLLKNRKSEENTDKYIDAIHHSADSLVSMVNDVLDLSKMETGKMTLNAEVFSLRKELNLLIESFAPNASKKGIYLRTDVAQNLPDQVKGDSRRFKQVLYNLISNAIKFTDKGGVLIRCAQEKSDAKQLILKVDVVDTGTGISSQALQNIFEDYVQAGHADRGGTGLGLGIARQLARLMGGDIHVESELNKGSQFSFTVVFEKVEGESSQMKVLGQSYVEELAKQMGSGYILVVDDYPYNRMLAIDTLKQWFPELRCIEVVSGEDALKEVKREEPVLILMDVRMVPMSGLECTRILRTFSKVPVIALTASVLTTDREDCLNSGMNEVVLKPFNSNELLTAIGSVLNLPAQASDYSNDVILQTEWPYLEELCEGNVSKIDKYLRIALEEGPVWMEEIRSAQKKSDPIAVKKGIHRSISYLYSAEIHSAATQAQTWESVDGIEILKDAKALENWLMSIEEGLRRVSRYLETKKKV